MAIFTGCSPSFPEDEAFFAEARKADGVYVVLGSDVEGKIAAVEAAGMASLVLVELGTECLGLYTGEAFGEEGSTVLGISRFALGDEGLSNLIELVVQPRSLESAVALARDLLAKSGFDIVQCTDAPGRIVNAVLRPYLNAVLARLDDGLASAEALDLAIEQGLGHRDGPVKMLRRAGLARHCDVTEALAQMAGGQPGFAPPRRAVVARSRERQQARKRSVLHE